MRYNKSDFKVKFTRDSGPGGQHRNKVETTAIVEHIPTGIIQRCSETRSQRTNLERAIKIILSKIQATKEAEQHNRLNSIRKDAIWDTSNGSKRIRTYNFTTGIVKDHRTEKTAPVKKVLDGHIDLLR